MFDYAPILKENPNGVLATQDGDKVKTRIFMCLGVEDNKVFFCTNNQKPVFAQMQANAHVSFCTYTANYTPVVSISGKAVFISDVAIKQKALDDSPMINNIYKSADNPVFEVFYIAVEEVEVFSFQEGTKNFKV